MNGWVDASLDLRSQGPGWKTIGDAYAPSAKSKFRCLPLNLNHPDERQKVLELSSERGSKRGRRKTWLGIVQVPAVQSSWSAAYVCVSILLHKRRPLSEFLSVSFPTFVGNFASSTRTFTFPWRLQHVRSNHSEGSCSSAYFGRALYITMGRLLFLLWNAVRHRRIHEN